MSEQLVLEIATPSGLALQTECDSVAAPSVQGEFGVFPGHLPVLAVLRSGVVSFVVGGETQRVAVGPGFIEAGAERVQVLTDAFALPEDVDADEVRDQMRDAEERLSALDTSMVGSDFEEIERDIQWADAQLALVKSDH